MVHLSLILLVGIYTDKCFEISFICQYEFIFDASYQTLQNLSIFLEHDTIIWACDENTVLPWKETWVNRILGDTAIDQAIKNDIVPISTRIFGDIAIRVKFQTAIRGCVCIVVIFHMTSDWCFQTHISACWSLGECQTMIKMSTIPFILWRIKNFLMVKDFSTGACVFQQSPLWTFVATLIQRHDLYFKSSPKASIFLSKDYKNVINDLFSGFSEIRINIKTFSSLKLLTSFYVDSLKRS